MKRDQTDLLISKNKKRGIKPLFLFLEIMLN